MDSSFHRDPSPLLPTSAPTSSPQAHLMGNGQPGQGAEAQQRGGGHGGGGGHGRGGGQRVHGQLRALLLLHHDGGQFVSQHPRSMFHIWGRGAAARLRGLPEQRAQPPSWPLGAALDWTVERCSDTQEGRQKRAGAAFAGGWRGLEPFWWWGHLLHSAAYRVRLDNRPGLLLTGCVTLGKLLNISEP